MVNFVQNHPYKPFLMGGMFHGGTALGGFADNRIKSIMTRSWHKVVFTEDESIIITDKSGNEIHLDEVMQNLNNIMHRTNAKFIDYYKIYFLEESLGGLYGRCYDIGAPEKSVIVLTLGFNDSTVAHESLHAMSLFHTFDNDSKYTFLNFETDNVMDYSDFENRKFPVISTFSWQWKRLFNFLK